MGTMFAKSGSYEFDGNGERAPGALAYFFAAGTSTPYTVYQDADESTPHEHPVEADGNGRWPAIFVPFGDFKVIITTAGGTTLFSVDDVPNPAPFTDDFELDETAIYNTGDFIFTGKNGTRTGAVRCNGRTIGNAASGATERANADTADLYTYLYDNYTNDEAAVSGGRGSSAAADYAANKTITLPDYRGTVLVGFDDMGNTAASRFTGAPVGTGSAIEAGSILGLNTHTLQTTEIPSHTHAAGTFAADSNGAHTHTGTTDSGGGHTPSGSVSLSLVGSLTSLYIGTYNGVNSDHTAAGSNGSFRASTVNFTGSTASFTGNAVSAHTHTFTTASNGAHTHTISGTSASTGGDGAHNNMQRSAPVNILMKL
jgi:microcystin-dependent protein